MPFIKFFCCNVRHAVALVIYFSFYLLISLHFSFHLSTFREYSIYLWLISLTASKELPILLLKLYNDGAIGISASILGPSVI